jgi:hypothetical protein
MNQSGSRLGCLDTTVFVVLFSLSLLLCYRDKEGNAKEGKVVRGKKRGNGIVSIAILI